MSQINDTSIVTKQYADTNNLNTRISIHEKYSTNKMGFMNWIISKYEINDGMKVLELGCGTGDIWKKQDAIINNCSKLVLSDFSDAMVNETKNNLKEYKNIEYKVVDIQNIPFDNDSFDVIIANMMLYHVPDLSQGLKEVRRVLKNGGKFYCATYGEHGIIQYLSKILSKYGVQDNVNKNFTLQNGKNILSEIFDNVKQLDYQDSLQVTDVEDMVDYIYSLSGMTTLSQVPKESVRKVLIENMADGFLNVPKEYGMFIAY